MSDKLTAEYKDIMSQASWPQVFQNLCRDAQKFGYTCVEARKPENKTLNRYRDVNPFDHTRIVLNRGTVHYINANIVKVEQVDRTYILTQGPLPQSVGHFWLMIWEQNSSSILMLNKIIEKNEIKCHMYWPTAEGPEHQIVLEDVSLTVQLVHQENFNYYVSRLLRLQDLETGDSRDILQFHYTTWPDFGVPSSPHAFLEFLKHVRESGALKPESGPAVVHCSAGIGRSGTFCLVDSCLLLAERGEEKIDVQKILLEMRRYRMGLVQTPDQLRFAYMAIIEGKKRLSPDWDGSVEEPMIIDVAEDKPPPPPPRTGSLHSANTLLNQDVLPEEPSDSSSGMDDSDDESELTDSDVSLPDTPPSPSSEKDWKSVHLKDGIAAVESERNNEDKSGKDANHDYTLYILVASALVAGAIAVIYNYYY